MNRSTIQNNNHSNNDSKGINDATTILLPLPPTPPTTSELSPLDSRESQGQGLGPGLMQPNGLISDDEITTTRDNDPTLAINGSIGELSVEDRCVRVLFIPYQHKLARHLIPWHTLTTFSLNPFFIHLTHPSSHLVISPLFFIPARTVVCREEYRNINIGTASQ